MTEGIDSALDPPASRALNLHHLDISARADGVVRLPSADLVFSGHYEKVGADLVVSSLLRSVTIHDFFRGDTHPALVAPDGASLSGATAAALAHASHAQAYAQVTPPTAPKAIGRVESVAGSATAVRNGGTVQLHAGDLVYKGDAVQTESSSTLAITFLDGTAFNLSASARMVLSEMVYEPSGASNSSLLSLVQGSITFVAGQIAHTGDMKVDTPVATMGIRGTAVLVDISADNGPTRFSVMREPDGRVGTYVLYDKTNPATIIANVSQPDIVTILQANGNQIDISLAQKSPVDFQNEQVFVAQVFQTFATGQQNPLYNQLQSNPNANPGQPAHTPGSSGGSSTPPDLQTNPVVPNDGHNDGAPPPSQTPIPPTPPVAPPQDATPNTSPAPLTLLPAPVVPTLTITVDRDHVVTASANQGLLAYPDQPNEYVTEVHAAAHADTPVTGPTSVIGTYGTLTIAPDGSYTYAANHAQALSDHQTGTDTFTATVANAQGTLTTTTLTFDVIGASETVSSGGSITTTIGMTPTIAAGTIANGAILVPYASSPLTPVGAADLVASHNLVNGLGGTAGFGTNQLAAGDDNSSSAIDITSVFGTSGLNFFGHSYTSLYINNNGNITFADPFSGYTPSAIDAGASNPIIAPFWADVDTRGGSANGANTVFYDLDPTDGVLTITWDNVGYYAAGTDKLNAFQVQLINEGGGNFDIVYRYQNINWTTGSASGGTDGLGGTAARAGYSAGDGTNYYELPQSGNQAAILALPTTVGNTGIAGVDVFEVHNGNVTASTLTTSGTIDFSDPQLDATHTIQSVTYTGGGTDLGTLSLVKVADTTGSGVGGEFAWTYTADSNAVEAALSAAGANGTKVETFDVVISDGYGDTVTQTVSVTLALGDHFDDAATASAASSIVVSESGATATSAYNTQQVTGASDLGAAVTVASDGHSIAYDPTHVLALSGSAFVDSEEDHFNYDYMDTTGALHHASVDVAVSGFDANSEITQFSAAIDPVSGIVTLSGDTPGANGESASIDWGAGPTAIGIANGAFSVSTALGVGDHVATLTLNEPGLATRSTPIDIDIGGNDAASFTSSTGGPSILVGSQNGVAQTIVGSQDADTLIAGNGNTTLTGNGGGDTFVFKTNMGNDAITDFHVDTTGGAVPDHIDVSAFHFANANALLAATTDVDGNAVIALGGHTLTIDAVDKAHLQAHTDLFVI